MVNISCVVPAYKRVDQTGKTIELLLGSEGVGKEFGLEVIVADSSPDDFLKDALAKKFGDRITYLRPPKPGIAANKNAGANAAKYPILVFCDSDMEVEKNVLSATIHSLKTHEKAAAIGGTVFWRGGPNDGQKDRPRLEDRLMIKDITTYTEALYSRYLATYKSVFNAVGGYDEEIFNMRGEGSDMSVRYWRAGFPLAYEEAIVVHHVFDAPDAAAIRIKHPEWGIFKDLLLLGYKYDMFASDCDNFSATVDINFSPLGADGYFRTLQGIGRHYDLIVTVKPALDAFRANDRPQYDFKFLEVFSVESLFSACINKAASRLADARKEAFGE